MSQAQLIGIISALFGMLLLLVGIIYRALDKRVAILEGRDYTALLQSHLDAIKEDVADIEGRAERFAGMDKAREDAWAEWRRRLEVQIERMEAQIQAAPVLVQRVFQSESFIKEIREWLHLWGKPYVPRAIDDLKDRIDRFERTLNGERRGDER